MSKKILIMDALSPKGHHDINKVILNITKRVFDVYYTASEEFMEPDFEEVKINPIDKTLFEITSNSLYNRINLYKALKKMTDYALVVNPEYILVMSYDAIVFPLYFIFHPARYNALRYKFLLLNHSNIDEIFMSRAKRMLFRMNSCKHLVYEEFILNECRNHNILNMDVFHHTLNDYKLKYCKNRVSPELKEFFEEDDCFIIISPSTNSLDEKRMTELMDLDKSGYLRIKKIKIFIKDKTVKYKSKNAWFFNEYLNDDEYSYVLENAHYVLMMYNEDVYRYRVSGVYFDAVTFGKPVIYSPALFFLDQERRFSKIGIKIEGDFQHAFDLINEGDYENSVKAISNVRRSYSDNTILSELMRLM